MNTGVFVTTDEYNHYMILYMFSAESGDDYYTDLKEERKEYLEYLHKLLEKYNQPKGYSYTINENREILKLGDFNDI